MPANSMSPLCNEWPSAPAFLQETSMLLRQIYHKWRVSGPKNFFKQILMPLSKKKNSAINTEFPSIKRHEIA